MAIVGGVVFLASRDIPPPSAAERATPDEEMLIPGLGLESPSPPPLPEPRPARAPARTRSDAGEADQLRAVLAGVLVELEAIRAMLP